jgi:serine protease 7
VTGWNLADGRSTYLQQEKQPVIFHEQCKEIYNQSKYQIWYKQLCAGGRINDTCLGDGGSPLQAHSIYGKSVRMVQQGIVSYGAVSCGVAGIPDVYTRVAYYMDWILNTMTD